MAQINDMLMKHAAKVSGIIASKNLNKPQFFNDKESLKFLFKDDKLGVLLEIKNGMINVIQKPQGADAAFAKSFAEWKLLS